MKAAPCLGLSISGHFLIGFFCLSQPPYVDSRSISNEARSSLRIVTEYSAPTPAPDALYKTIEPSTKTNIQSLEFTRKKYWELKDVEVKPELLSVFQLNSQHAAYANGTVIKVAIYISSEGNVDFLLPGDGNYSKSLLEDLLAELAKQRFKPASRQAKNVPSILYVELQIDGYQLHSE